MIKQLTVDACSAAVADLADHAQLIRWVLADVELPSTWCIL